MAKKKRIKSFAAFGAFVMLVVLITIIIQLDFKKEEKKFELIDFLAGYELTNLTTKDNTIILVNDAKSVEFEIDPIQMLSIKTITTGEISKRPFAHDLIKHILNEYNIDLVAVRIHGKKGDLYYADMLFLKDNKALSLDSRPSDAIAIALRLNKPIYTKKELLVS